MHKMTVFSLRIIPILHILSILITRKHFIILNCLFLVVCIFLSFALFLIIVGVLGLHYHRIVSYSTLMRTTKNIFFSLFLFLFHRNTFSIFYFHLRIRHFFIYNWRIFIHINLLISLSNLILIQRKLLFHIFIKNLHISNSFFCQNHLF